MTANFSIRNLTGETITLDLLERFKAAANDSSPLDSVTNLGRNLTNFSLSTAGAPSGPKLAEHAQPFMKRDVDIRIEPFTIQRTDLKGPVSSENEIVRLTFALAGQKYRMDCPSPNHLSQSLTCLGPNPKFHFTGVYLPRESFVCIFNSADLDRWQQHLHDATPLSALSIPGTHNSPTCHNALPSVRCQAVSPRDQLNNGVRFFDIRVQVEAPNSPKLILVHGVFPISLTGTKYFRDLEETVVTWLKNHPSETVIISLKREGTGDGKDEDLARILAENYTSDASPHGRAWYDEPAIPTLGQARGKIVLLRRFRLDEPRRKMHNGKGFGINAAAWADNCAHDMQDNVCVQDFYEVLETMNIDKKLKFAEEQCERAGDVTAHLPGITTDAKNPAPRQPFYLNFLSASNFWKVGCWPEAIAKKLNPGIIDHLARMHHVEGWKRPLGVCMRIAGGANG